MTILKSCRRPMAILVAVALAGIAVSNPDSAVRAVDSGYISLPAPARVLDTRADGSTIDGQFRGGGVRPTGSTLQLPVAGRAGVPGDAAAVVMNVTVADTAGSGFVTVYPCGTTQPTSSNLNFVAGKNIPNLVIAKVGAGGAMCLFTSASTQLIVDVAGYFPGVDALTPLPSPVRLLDTRPGGITIDSVSAGGGLRPAGAVQILQVSGRAGMPTGLSSAVLNVTVDDPRAAGFITVYPCDAALPTASNVNYVAGQTIPNAVISKVSAAGTVCLFNSSPTQLIVDAAGYFANATVLIPLGAPARLLDTRTDGTTIDSAFRAGGIRPSGGTVQLTVAGRAGIPANASAVVLNVTVDQAQAAGFVTVYPTGVAQPNASNLNYVAGQTVPNAVIARLGSGGTLCLFNSGATHLIVDVAAYLTGPASAAAGATCPADPVAPPPTTPPTTPPTAPPPTTPPTTPSTAPPPGNPGDTKNCTDFATYQQAKAWFDTYYPLYGDVAKLDQDGDLIPCESLPGAPK